MDQSFIQPTDLTKRKHFDILDGSMACVLFIVLQFVVGFIIAFVGIKNRVVYEIFSAIMQLCFVGAVFFVAKIRKVDWIEACNFKKKVDGKIVLYALGLAVICLLLFTDVTSAFMAMLEKIGYNSPLNTGTMLEYTKITNIWEYLASIVTVCIIPPLCEETLFRGAVLNSFRGLNKWLGIFISGFCFMIMHGNPDQTIHQFILGIVLGYIAWETRNIWVCVLIHAINNFIAITITFAYSLISAGADAGAGAEEIVESVEYSWGDIAYTAIFGIVSAAIGVYLVIWLTKKLKNHIEKKNIASTQTNQQQTGTENLQPKPEILVTQNGQTVSITEQQEEFQPKPNKTKIALTVLSYVAFIAYFLKEWITYLLLGLGG